MTKQINFLDCYHFPFLFNNYLFFQEFNLTKPKPKLMPEVEKIEVGFKANPAPKNKKDLKGI